MLPGEGPMPRSACRAREGVSVLRGRGPGRDLRRLSYLHGLVDLAGSYCPLLKACFQKRSISQNLVQIKEVTASPNIGYLRGPRTGICTVTSHYNIILDIK